tara:strand:+ start:197 stop:556 length:360 start_codon:yes stop_codon:yes gene_type:complete
MHEDGDDESRFQEHEQENQTPPKISLKVEIIDKIRKGAENEQQDPNFYVNPKRMLLTLNICHAETLPKIKECEDENPNQINEMPIKAHRFDNFVIAFPAGEKAALFRVVIAAPNLAGDQ